MSVCESDRAVGTCARVGDLFCPVTLFTAFTGSRGDAIDDECGCSKLQRVVKDGHRCNSRRIRTKLMSAVALCTCLNHTSECSKI